MSSLNHYKHSALLSIIYSPNSANWGEGGYGYIASWNSMLERRQWLISWMESDLFGLLILSWISCSTIAQLGKNMSAKICRLPRWEKIILIWNKVVITIGFQKYIHKSWYKSSQPTIFHHCECWYHSSRKDHHHRYHQDLRLHFRYHKDLRLHFQQVDL